MIPQSIPQRCTACGRYCDGCPLSKAVEGRRVTSVEHSDPLSAARGIFHAVLLSVAAWAAFVGFILLIYFNVHA